MKVTQLITARTAAGKTRLPWQVLRAELERAGYRVVKIAGRERVAESDLVAFIEACRQPTSAEAADRVGLAIALAARELGIKTRPRGRRDQRGVRGTGGAVAAGQAHRDTANHILEAGAIAQGGARGSR